GRKCPAGRGWYCSHNFHQTVVDLAYSTLANVYLHTDQWGLDPLFRPDKFRPEAVAAEEWARIRDYFAKRGPAIERHLEKMVPVLRREYVLALRARQRCQQPAASSSAMSGHPAEPFPHGGDGTPGDLQHQAGRLITYMDNARPTLPWSEDADQGLKKLQR